MQADFKAPLRSLAWVIFLAGVLFAWQSKGVAAAQDLGWAVHNVVSHELGRHKCDRDPLDRKKPHHRCEHSARLGNTANTRSKSNFDPNPVISAHVIPTLRVPKSVLLPTRRCARCPQARAARAPFWATFARTSSLLN